jgi:hypothetical protein
MKQKESNDDNLRLITHMHPQFHEFIAKFINQGYSELEAVKKVEDLVIEKGFDN